MTLAQWVMAAFCAVVWSAFGYWRGPRYGPWWDDLERQISHQEHFEQRYKDRQYNLEDDEL